MAITEKQRQEGTERLAELVNMLELNPNLLKYLKEGRIYYSYVVSGLFGCIDIITYEPEYARLCSEFEENTGAYVYHAIETDTPYGKLLTMLFVSSEENEADWKRERVSGEVAFVYVYNVTEDFGEYGSILLASDNGALLRKG